MADKIIIDQNNIFGNDYISNNNYKYYTVGVENAA